MAGGLKRDLGLGATTAIAIGAMVGSGIFILPGIAYTEAGGMAAVWAFIFAGVLVLPAAISAAEMATAMPEDGGPYLFVERGMGPLMGTVAGVGTWLMLSLKSALALVGGVPYLALLSGALAGSFSFLGLSIDAVIILALALAALFTAINVLSAKGSGSFQFALVAILMLVLFAYIAAGTFDADFGAYGFSDFDPVTGGIVAATATIFVAFAGVTKVAAVAEEVKDPGTIIPQAMIGSVVIVTLMYALTVLVSFLVVDVQALIDAPQDILWQDDYVYPGEADATGALSSDGEGAIIAFAAAEFLGTIGVLAVIVAALLALASTANAGLLAASRFPLAMARDGVFPSSLDRVSERFNTPVPAVLLTGGVIAVMVFFPIQVVASFGSAFQILVFILLNLAVIAFRRGDAVDYNPEFTSPLYPWVQIFGAVGGLVVLSQMPTSAIAGALGIAALAVIWYFVYARKHIDHDSPGLLERMN